ncbi:MAG: type II secretion system protein [Candidatus Methylomirabilales bacterium]
MIQKACPPTPKGFDDTIPSVHHGWKRYHRGFSIIELLIVLAILGTLAGLAIPMYFTALDKAKVAKTIADIHTLSNEISSYQLFNGSLPTSLADIGKANFEDPYGIPMNIWISLA